MKDNPSGEPSLRVNISRDGDDLAWEVENVGSEKLWAFLLIPTIRDGRTTFAEDAAWLEMDDQGTLVVRKVDTPVPDDIDVDAPVRSGAVLLAPGDRRRGRTRLGNEVTLRAPYRGDGKRVVVPRVVLEVGWVPHRADQSVKMLEWEGQPFAYLDTAKEPGGQRLTRSEPLQWATQP